ncbi:acyl-CoA dehydrogenase family protein [Mucilaginibacter phyllosphaerae]|uniref:Acyl-CoA dehydrogenase n=1 Tax=Mucilaginibacter phyllosphaerae TaxID=1812349 RepID=A0A4Y8A815_9SPHI|nr:acyl-CoA dehydrogenase family protein [Mucilaginibacter phyllosphaerae]MBB3971136.1 alkylation response protein AidB-like acyl-CoA dehydrogenase [Mucilaginibacter phyllosphaerae]TEW63865.1 acyl-CoA dehydrogenase [Mucilaginibacter phyllosphaerae]GGH22690.1 acyl-CoA dehydrogenase [Mucilaginibacter phyllosphaerae]
MSTATENKHLKGGEFLIKTTDAADVFIPENWDEEQLMIAQTCQEFVEQKVVPAIDRIDKQEEGLMVSLIDQAGELGILSVSIPEEYGGFGKDFPTAMLISEKTGPGASFSVAVMAHTGIGTLPILYYGNEEQKNKYIPKLGSGEWKGAYCLTEPGAGSDANSGKTRATLSADGKHYLINGQKMWITNAGFADIFTVFAKIDNDENLSAFIVEKGFEGLSLNPEEHKMGIKGSSTRQVFFNDCQVPVENLLSERGNGFKIAVNILNLGRIKLGGAALGASKSVITNAIRYANEREQFGRPIAKYGAIRYKLAEQAIRTYATEAAMYRASQNIEDAISNLIENGMEASKAKLKGTELFAIEAAIIKVHASEALDYVVDEGVQIYGGMGYSAEAPMDRAYRDSRINRIFEGTNEINRMLTVDMILKRAMKGELDLMGPAESVAKELMSIPDFNTEEETLFEKEKKYVANFKKAVLLIAGAAVQKLMTSLAKEQEVLMYLADMVIETYVSESVQLRVEKLAGQRGEAAIQDQIDMMQVYIRDSADKIFKAGKEALNSFAEGDERRMIMTGLKRYTKTEDLNATAARRRVAAKLIDNNKYCF